MTHEMPRQYQQVNEQTREELRAKAAIAHAKIPHVSDIPVVFDPSGLVPYPCDHGIAVKPARFPVTKGGTAWYDDAGDERPPFGGKSWGRSKYLVITSFGGRDGVPYAYAQCFVCLGRPVGDDFYVAADGTSLR